MTRFGTHAEPHAMRRAWAVSAACACAMAICLAACAPAEDSAEKPASDSATVTDVTLTGDDAGTGATVTTDSPADVPDSRPPLAADYVPEMPMLGDGQDEERVRKAVSDFLATSHPGEEIRSIRLMGNGTAPSQQGDGEGMWATFLVTLSTGDIGLMLTATPSTEPLVYETDRILVSDNDDEYYDVQTGKYLLIPVDEESEASFTTLPDDMSVQHLTEEEVRALADNPEMHLELLVNDWLTAGADPNALPPELEPYRSELLGN